MGFMQSWMTATQARWSDGNSGGGEGWVGVLFLVTPVVMMCFFAWSGAVAGGVPGMQQEGCVPAGRAGVWLYTGQHESIAPFQG